MKLAAAALRAVPVPKPNEPSGTYGNRLREWNHGRLEIETCAGNLALSAARASESEHPRTRELVAGLVSNPLTQTDTVKGQSRADRNEYMADYMRRKRASAKVQQ
jgi:hypothetical protein